MTDAPDRASAEHPARGAGGGLRAHQARLVAPENRAVLVATVVAAIVCAVYIAVPRMGNDLSAQLARADFAREHPFAMIDFRWFAGVLPYSYSLWTPLVMAYAGVKLSSAVAMVVSVGLLTRLFVRGAAPHPLLGGLAASVALGANLIEGRVTFGIGVAFGLGALLVLAESSAKRRIAAAALALLAAGASPVAALFLGLCAVALVLTRRIVDGLALGIAVCVPTVLTSVVFSDPGRQIFGGKEATRDIIITLVVVCVVSKPRVRIVGVLGAALVWGALLFDSPIGSNSSRLSMLFAMPILLAFLRMPAVLRKWKVPFPALAAVVAVVGYAIQPLILGGTVGGTGRLVTYPSYFAPVAAEIGERGPLTGRVEVPELTGHWDAAYLARDVPIARGWLRQLDTKLNEKVSYEGLPTAQTFRAFLDRNAVQYVAVADARGSLRGAREKRLIAAGLPYLTKVWTSRHWTLYAVQNPVPLVTGPARLDSQQPDRITFTVTTAGTVTVRVRWSRYLALSGPAGTCLHRSGLQQVELRDAAPGTYRIASAFPSGSRTC
ncbi:MAG: hypothetical protein ACR2KJ_18830 [Jatrophihabitans sp.]